MVDRTYKIFKQSIHEIDMYTHMQRWQTLLEAHLGRPLLSTDHLFPHLSKNGLIHPDRHMSHTRSQDLISEFASGAGLTKHFSTHCFRRGGAQYRFMYAPLGKRWSLSMIRWWGAWAGEQVSVKRGLWAGILAHCCDTRLTCSSATLSMRCRDTRTISARRWTQTGLTQVGVSWASKS